MILDDRNATRKALLLDFVPHVGRIAAACHRSHKEGSYGGRSERRTIGTGGPHVFAHVFAHRIPRQV